jgi:hypothetical protein
LVTTGVLTLIGHISGGQTQITLRNHPGLFGVVVGGFLVTSMVLQAMLTRQGPKTECKSAA